MKHKLLQTWARKSAKLLAAIALLATTAFGAKAETSYIIQFSTGTNANGTDLSNKNVQDFVVETSKEFVSGTFSNVSKAYGNTPKGVKLGSSDKAGIFGFNLESTKCTAAVKSITINGAYFNNDKDANMGIKIYLNGSTSEAGSLTGFQKDELGAKTLTLADPIVISSIKLETYNTENATVTSTYKARGYVECITLAYDNTPVDPNKPAAPTFTPDGGEVDANSTVTIAGDDKTQSLKYWFGEDATSATTVTGATATVTITEACTLNAIAIGEGNVESGVKTASYTLTPAINTYKQITNELTSGKYVFMCGENFVNPVLVSNRCNFTDDFTKTDDQIVASEKYEFTITIDGEYATIQGVNGKYLGIANASVTEFMVAEEALTDNFKWKFTVDNGVVTFTSAISNTNVLAQHMGTSRLYKNFAPGKVEGSVYPTLYKLYVAPVAPELPAPTAEDGVEVDVVDGGWGIRPEKYPVTLTFAVEDGVQIYAKKLTAAQAAAEDDNDGYTALPDNKLILTKSGEEYSVYAMKDGVKSVAKSIVADAATGIAGIEAEDGEAVYFNLQGVRVQNPENGVFIRVQNGKAVKIVK